MSRLPFAAMLLCAVSAAGVFGQQDTKKRPARNYPPKMEGAKVEVYKTVGDVKLKIYVFSPKGHRAGDSRPARKMTWAQPRPMTPAPTKAIVSISLVVISVLHAPQSNNRLGSQVMRSGKAMHSPSTTNLIARKGPIDL